MYGGQRCVARRMCTRARNGRGEGAYCRAHTYDLITNSVLRSAIADDERGQQPSHEVPVPLLYSQDAKSHMRASVRAEEGRRKEESGARRRGFYWLSAEE